MKIEPEQIEKLKEISKNLKKESKKILESYKNILSHLRNELNLKDLKTCEKNLAWIDKKFNKHPREVKDLTLEKFNIFYNQLSEEIKQDVSKDNLKTVVEFIAEFHDVGRHLEVNLKTLQKENFGIDHAVLGADFLQGFFNDETIKVDPYLTQCIDFAIRNHSTNLTKENELKNDTKDELKMQLLHFLKQMDMLANVLVYIQGGELEKIGEWGWVNKEGFDVKSAEISKEIMEDLTNHKLVNSKNIKTMGDVICKFISWLNILDDIYCAKTEKQNITKGIIEQAQKTFDKKEIVHNVFDTEIKKIIISQKQYNILD